MSKLVRTKTGSHPWITEVEEGGSSSCCTTPDVASGPSDPVTIKTGDVSDNTPSGDVSIETGQTQGDGGNIILKPGDGDNQAGSIELLHADGSTAATIDPASTTFLDVAIFMFNLPIQDPGVSGQLWNDVGTLKVSFEL